MSDEIIATLSASSARRGAALAMLMVLATLLILLAFSPEMAFGYRAFLLILGLGVCWTARGLHRGTKLSLLLKKNGISLSDGTMLAPLENMVKVDRGTFAFKPSNGFLVVLREAPGRSWAPGLYWVIGKKMGVGGVTSRAEGKFFAKALAMQLARSTPD